MQSGMLAGSAAKSLSNLRDSWECWTETLRDSGVSRFAVGDDCHAVTVELVGSCEMLETVDVVKGRLCKGCSLAAAWLMLVH